MLLGKDSRRTSFSMLPYGKFTSSLTNHTSLPDQGICDLLEITCTELPDRVNEDPLREQIFWYAASRLTQLQNYDYFLRLLEMHKDL